MVPIVLAHGALGEYDELVFLLIGVVFVALMIGAWWFSRSRRPAVPPSETPPPPTETPNDETSADHFPLA